MKLITTIFLLCFLLKGQVFSQDKRDYIWFSASQTDLLPGIETNLFDFNNPSQVVEPGESILQYDRNNALICDREGQLLFYSNGCAVADRLHRIMPNGDSINAGIFFDTSWLGNCDFGFPGNQDILALPDPADSLGFFLVTKLPEYTLEGEVKQRTVQFSYINLRLNDGYGDVTIKNKIIHDSVNYSVAGLNAIEHINKKDYWILQPAEDSKVYTFLLDETGISLQFAQDIFPEIDYLTASAGTSTFSTDGKLFAFNNSKQGIFLFDFDRETGVLSNQRIYPLSSGLGIISIEFSPSNQFIYAALTDSLYQVDLWEQEVEEAAVLIDTWDGTFAPFPPFAATFSMCKLAPDCRIYIAPGSSSSYYHFINKPDEKGLACDFRQRGLELPWISPLGNFPNYPRFRVDDEEKCDPSITSMFGEVVYYEKPLEVYPNPAIDHLTVNLPDASKGLLILMDLTGQVFYNKQVGGSSIELQTDELPAGMYFIEFLPEENRDLVIYSAKVVVR